MFLKKDMFIKVGMLNPECDGAQDFDLVLKLEASGAKLQNVPFFLYAWRVHSDSTASNIGTKSYASVAGVKAFQNYTKIKKLDWDIVDGVVPTQYRAIPQLKSIPSVHVIIPFKDQKQLTLKAIASLLIQDCIGMDKIKITAVDNLSEDKTIAEELTKLGIEVINFNEPFNYSRINNTAVKNTLIGKECDVLLFLNNDVQLQKNALIEMLRWVGQPKIGIIGCKLLYPNKSVQHVGIEYSEGSISPAYTSIKTALNYGLRLRTPFQDILRPVDAVTAACCLIEKRIFEEVGGFDEIYYPVSYSDVDLCEKIKSKGLFCFYTPYATGIHYEGLSRGRNALEDVEESGWLRNIMKNKRIDFLN